MQGVTLAEQPVTPFQARERVACGASHPDPEINAGIEAMRSAEQARTDGFNGCGHAGIWSVMFRCVECGRWLHRECARKHFETYREHGHPR